MQNTPWDGRHGRQAADRASDNRRPSFEIAKNDFELNSIISASFAKMVLFGMCDASKED